MGKKKKKKNKQTKATGVVHQQDYIEAMEELSLELSFGEPPTAAKGKTSWEVGTPSTQGMLVKRNSPTATMGTSQFDIDHNHDDDDDYYYCCDLEDLLSHADEVAQDVRRGEGFHGAAVNTTKERDIIPEASSLVSSLTTVSVVDDDYDYICEVQGITSSSCLDGWDHDREDWELLSTAHTVMSVTSTDHPFVWTYREAFPQGDGGKEGDLNGGCVMVHRETQETPS